MYHVKDKIGEQKLLSSDAEPNCSTVFMITGKQISTYDLSWNRVKRTR